jgi:hypothetical protein
MISGISDRWFDNDKVLVVVVAVVTEGVDWAAYQDALSVTGEFAELSNRYLTNFLALRASSNGDKLSEAEARGAFPGISLPYRR